MKCTVDGATLTMTERNGIEIDYCPTCRGVWLDRGELDKIIATVAPAAAPQPAGQPPAHRPGPRMEERRWRDDDDDDHRYRSGHRRRRESFLSDLFDF